MKDELERVILVNSAGEEIGVGLKLPVHREAALHRAFSVLVFNDAGDLLLQRRAEGKYHTAGLWSNTCCGHPRPGEDTDSAARRRLEEEMGFSCELTPLFHFTYRVELQPGLWEHEFDHVFLGRYEADPLPAPTEVGEWRWAPLAEVQREARERPEKFTPWFRILLEKGSFQEVV